MFDDENSPEKIALARISKAASNKDTFLDFSNLGLSVIPAEIEELSLHLKGLSLNNNPQLEFSLEIKKLTKLDNLIQLSLTYNSLDSLPEGIGLLRNLANLDISHNNLRTLNAEIGLLTDLSNLDISNNCLALLPNEIAKLTKLEILNIYNNQLTSLPLETGKLISIKRLSLFGNQITTLPKEIANLQRIQLLDLRDNSLMIPPEILDKINEPKTILSYYFSLVDKQRKPLNETKLLFVGQGSVGKTSLVQKILHGTFDQNQTKTEGISINQWRIDDGQQTISSTVNGSSSIKLNIWDFGGQEIMHATHQFFLTKRSLYLLVLDARLTQEENRVEYWLKIIQSFGGESPVLIVGNKTDQHPLDIDRTGLQKKYPNVVGILETSAATGAGIEALKAAIEKQVHTLPHVRDLLPETWFTVKSKLEELGRVSNFISQDRYLSMCAANNIIDETSQRTLISFLHDLGVILHFQDDPRLEALGILNPQWVTNGVYKILNSHELFQNKGVLSSSMLNKILDLPEYPRDKHLFIVDMMKKFELCYDIEPDKSFLIPDLLPKDEPFTGEWDDILAFQYHYNVLPTSIISRFIVRMNTFVHKTVWRSGVVLKSGGNTALVKADIEDRKIYICVAGGENTRRDFLSAIRMEFDAIHKTFTKIEVTEKVPLPNHPNADPIDYKYLIHLELEGRETIPVLIESKLIDINVHQLLDGLSSSNLGQELLRADKIKAENKNIFERLRNIFETLGKSKG